ncbi:TPA: LuxR family transcriptional regulator [Serratia odorifera]|nr:LuxR family transcriptional regulator [Serratia odorifera]
MNSVMTLAVLDQNIYFAKGLTKALSAHFYARGIETRRVDEQHLHQADLVFQYVPSGSRSCFCHCAALAEARYPLYLALRRPENRRKRELHSSCQLESGIIYHDMSVAAVLRKVSLALEQRRSQPAQLCGSDEECVCPQYLLTQREREIMVCLRQEMRISDIARRLAISVKTASNHKMNVMRKMGFQRNSELYYWLRQGTMA